MARRYEEAGALSVCLQLEGLWAVEQPQDAAAARARLGLVERQVEKSTAGRSWEAAAATARLGLAGLWVVV